MQDYNVDMALSQRTNVPHNVQQSSLLNAAVIHHTAGIFSFKYNNFNAVIPADQKIGGLSYW